MNVTPGTVITSNAIAVSGINTPAAISVSGGAYSIGCAGGFTTASGTVANGQTVWSGKASDNAAGPHSFDWNTLTMGMAALSKALQTDTVDDYRAQHGDR